jgi:tRNA modification GTPase
VTATARLLTPPGPAAIAVIQVAGAGAGAALERVFRPRGRKADATLGAIGAGDLADEVIVVRHGDGFEICGHGGSGTVARVLGALREAGVEAAPPGPLPLAARARTWLGVRVASWVEAGLLAPDDPVVAPLLEPRRVVLAGAPNAGKSSLFNALLERERAIVSEVAGTTRDVIEEETALEGVPMVLCDCAGTPSAPAPGIDGAAADRARRALAGADLAIRCIDGSVGWDGRAREDELLAITKSDLPAAFEAPAGALRVSARTRDGLDALARAIATRLLGRDPRGISRPEASR